MEKPSGSIRVLAVGDVIGRPGRKLLREALPILAKAYNYDCSVVNVENAAGGFGMTPDTYKEFLNMNIDCMTSGNHIYDKKGTDGWILDTDRLLRPENFPPSNPGRGSMIVELEGGVKLAVANLIGRVFMKTYDCPFRAADEMIPRLREETPLILVDFHGEATSEKMAMGWYLSKRVSGVWGTHTHCPTADARILDEFTGYQSDLGMTGPYDSIIGMQKQPVIDGFLSLGRSPFQVAKHDNRLGGCLYDLDMETGRCVGIKSLFLSEQELRDIDAAEP